MSSWKRVSATIALSIAALIVLAIVLVIVFVVIYVATHGGVFPLTHSNPGTDATVP